MSASTTRLALYKPGGGSDGILPDEPVDIGKINSNMDVIDSVMGAPGYTSTSRPATPFDGQFIKETDTKKVMRYSQSGAAWEEVVPPAMGRTTIKPTVTASTGTAVLVGNKIVCTGVTVLSVNNIFSALYDNYEILIKMTANTGGDLNIKLRAAGVDSVAGAYTYLRKWSQNGAAESVAQSVNVTTGWYVTANTNGFGEVELQLFSPNLAEVTMGHAIFNNVGAFVSHGTAGVFFNNNLQADGFTLALFGAGTFTGTITIYGKGM